MTAAIKKIVLIVHSDAKQCEQLAAGVASKMRTTACYSDPIHALAAMRESRVDAIIVETDMPWVSGYATVTAAKARQPDVAAFLIADTPGNAAFAKGAGVQYFATPYDFDQINRALARALKEG